MNDSRFFNASQSKIQTLEPVAELLMVDPHEMHHRGVKVANVDGILGHVVTEIVSCAVRCAGFHATAGHPDCVTSRMMIPSALGTVPFALTSDSATKLAPPDHQRVFQQTSLFKVQHQRCAGLIGISTSRRAPAAQPAVMIPVRRSETLPRPSRTMMSIACS